MKMLGADPLYVRARKVLLDALDALQGQREAIILVGAQAIYVHTGEADLALQPYTTDADLALDPHFLDPLPELAQAMHRGGFIPTDQPGIWKSQQEQVTVDLLVPDAVGGSGRRAATLVGHDAKAARKARGLEGALVDRQPMLIQALDSTDLRSFPINVAGPAALLVAKVHKLSERTADPKRMKPKDAHDIYRLLRAIETPDLAIGLAKLGQDKTSAMVTTEAVTWFREHFTEASALGPQLTAAAVGILDDPDTITGSCSELARDLVKALANMAGEAQDETWH